MREIKTKVLIIGGGAAGLNSALHLKTKEVILIERNGSNSKISPWNLMVREREEIKEKILVNGKKKSNPQVLDAFFDYYFEVIDDLKNIGLKLRKSNIGLVPDYRLPGSKARKIFLQKLKNKVKILKSEVKSFLVSKKEKKIRGVKVFLFSSQEEVRIFFDYLIIASGGMAGLFLFNTGSNDVDGSILSLAYEAGLTLKDLEFFMFHPFLITDRRFPQMLVSGKILTKMRYENEKGEEFLSKEIKEALLTNNHHHIFPQMVREFYQQSLKSKIFGRLVCSSQWFERFKRENEFGFIFRRFKKEEIEKIEIHPAFHFSIGGLVINEKAQTSQENVYAAGEVAAGLHGVNRVGGLAILEALVFSKIAALDINSKLEKEKKKIRVFKKDNSIEEVGTIGISQEMKKLVWQNLGPIKNKEKLENFQDYLKKKKRKTSQEKLIEKIVQISLLRKNSIGSFYRDDLKENEKAPSSFLIKKEIVFK